MDKDSSPTLITLRIDFCINGVCYCISRSIEAQVLDDYPNIIEEVVCEEIKKYIRINKLIGKWNIISTIAV